MHSINRFLLFVLLSMPVFGQITGDEKTYAHGDTNVVNDWMQKAKDFSEAAKFDSALYYFSKSLNAYEYFVQIHDNSKNQELYINAMTNIGDTHRRMGKYDIARELLEKAVQLGIEKLDSLNLTLSNSYHDYAAILFFLSEYNEAIRFFRKSLKIRLHQLGELHPLVAFCYSNIGVCYRRKGWHDEAIEYMNKALTLELELYGETKRSIAGRYLNLGTIYWSRGDFEKSLSLLNKSLAVRKKLNLKGQSEVAEALTFVNMGLIYKDLRQFEKAELLIVEAIDKFKALLGPEHPRVAVALESLGYTYLESKNYNKAKVVFEKLLILNQKTYQSTPKDLAMSLIAMAITNSRLNNYSESLSQIKSAIQILEENRYEADLFFAYHCLSSIYDDLKKPYELVASSDSALIQANFPISDIGNLDEIKVFLAKNNRQFSSYELPYTIMLRAKACFYIYQKNKDIKILKQGIHFFDAALAAIDSNVENFEEKHSALHSGSYFFSIYENALQSISAIYNATNDKQYLTNAFDVFEKYKNAYLSRIIRESRIKQFAGVDSQFLEEERKLKLMLSDVENEINKRTPPQNAKDSTEVFEYHSNRFELKSKYDKLQNTIEKQYPDYSRLMNVDIVPSPVEIQSKLDPQTCLLNYFYGDSTLYIMAITKDDLYLKQIPISGNLDSLIETYHTSLAKFNNSEVERVAPELYRSLILPVADIISEKQHLVIIPDGELFRIPFETLFADDHKNFLIRDFDISYQYSASSFSESKNNRRSEPENGFAGFAPVFADNNQLPVIADSSVEMTDIIRFRSLFIDGEEYPVLPNTEKEILGIRQVFEDHRLNSDIFLHKAATEEMVKSSDLVNYRFVHLATHGFVNLERPRFSGILLSPPEVLPSPENGILYAGETYNLNLNADLVVLSACETGYGKIYRGEGAMALTRGFIYSGARNIITSYWSVQDKSTSDLMIEMYRNILNGRSFAASLRAAKLKLLDNPVTASPSIWGAFVLIGE